VYLLGGLGKRTQQAQEEFSDSAPGLRVCYRQSGKLGRKTSKASRAKFVKIDIMPPESARNPRLTTFFNLL
jgi:hypothetical protein